MGDMARRVAEEDERIAGLGDEERARERAEVVAKITLELDGLRGALCETGVSTPIEVAEVVGRYALAIGVLRCRALRLGGGS